MSVLLADLYCAAKQTITEKLLNECLRLFPFLVFSPTIGIFCDILLGIVIETIFQNFTQFSYVFSFLGLLYLSRYSFDILFNEIRYVIIINLKFTLMDLSFA